MKDKIFNAIREGILNADDICSRTKCDRCDYSGFDGVDEEHSGCFIELAIDTIAKTDVFTNFEDEVKSYVNK